MDKAKIKLSAEEYSLVINEEFILTKQRIIDKVYALFGELHILYKEIVTENVFFESSKILNNSARISKGEKYKYLPWVMLDYPNHFSGNDVFAVRSFFWWGNFFSITIHLSGRYKTLFEDTIVLHAENTLNHEWFICINEDEWQHDFSKNNYQPFLQIAGKHNFESELKEKKFIKMAKKMPFSNWNNANDFFTDGLKEIFRLLTSQPVK